MAVTSAEETAIAKMEQEKKLEITNLAQQYFSNTACYFFEGGGRADLTVSQLHMAIKN